MKNSQRTLAEQGKQFPVQFSSGAESYESGKTQALNSEGIISSNPKYGCESGQWNISSSLKIMCNQQEI